MFGKRFFTILVFLSLLSPGAASATKWRDAGQISPSRTDGQVTGEGVDAAGNYSALWRPIIGERDEAFGELVPVYGPALERERKPGGRFVTRGGFDANNGRLAVLPNGERIATSIRSGDSAQLEIRTRPPGGAWSKPQVVATASGDFIYRELKIETAPTGEVIVAWVNHDITAQPNSTTLMTSVRPAGGTAFTQAATLAQGTMRSPIVEMDAKGNALAAWAEPDSGALRIARRPAGGEWAAAEALSLPDRAANDASEAPTLAVAPNGRAALTWLTLAAGQSYPGVAGAIGSTTSSFGAPAGLSDKGNNAAAATDGNLSAFRWANDEPPNTRIQGVITSGAGADLATTPRRALSGGSIPNGFGDVVVAKGRATFAWSRTVGGVRVVEARSATASGKLTRTQILSPRTETASYVSVTLSSRGEPWVSWSTQERGPRAREIGSYAAKGSPRTGRFERAQMYDRTDALAPAPGERTLLPARGGAMFASVKRGKIWILRAYGGG
jgi:hypothetical protein